MAHGAVLHGCTIHDRVLIGMKAVILDHVVIQSNVLVAAGAVVLSGTTLESGWIYGGVPAKPIKKLNEEQIQFHISRTADAYTMYSSWFESE